MRDVNPYQSPRRCVELMSELRRLPTKAEREWVDVYALYVSFSAAVPTIFVIFWVTHDWHWLLFSLVGGLLPLPVAAMMIYLHWRAKNWLLNRWTVVFKETDCDNEPCR